MKKLTILFCLILLIIPVLQAQVPLRGVPEDFCEPGKEMDLFQNFENPSIDDHLRMLLLPGMQPGSSDLENAEAKIKGFWAELEQYVEGKSFSRKGWKLLSEFEAETLFLTAHASGSLGTALREGKYSSLTPICFRAITFQRFSIPYQLSTSGGSVEFSSEFPDWDLKIEPETVARAPSTRMGAIISTVDSFFKRLPKKPALYWQWKSSGSLIPLHFEELKDLEAFQWASGGLGLINDGFSGWIPHNLFERSYFLKPSLASKILLTSSFFVEINQPELTPGEMLTIHFRLSKIWDHPELLWGFYQWYVGYLEAREAENPDLSRLEAENLQLVRKLKAASVGKEGEKVSKQLAIFFYVVAAEAIARIDKPKALHWAKKGLEVNYDTTGSFYRLAMGIFISRIQDNPTLNEMESVFDDAEDFCDSLPGCLSDTNMIFTRALASGAISDQYFQRGNIKMGLIWLEDFIPLVKKMNITYEHEQVHSFPYISWVKACIKDQDMEGAKKAAEEGLKLFPRAEKLKSLRDQLAEY